MASRSENASAGTYAHMHRQVENIMYLVAHMMGDGGIKIFQMFKHRRSKNNPRREHISLDNKSVSIARNKRVRSRVGE